MRYDFFIGIDPGAKGAIAIQTLFSRPVVYDFKEGIVPEKLQNISVTIDINPAIALIERAHTMPQQGVVSSFKFGVNYGTWVGRLEALCIPYIIVSAKTWQNHMFKGAPIKYRVVKGKKCADTKNTSLLIARRLFPYMQDQLSNKRDHNRSDALLIAQYAICKYGGLF